MRITKIKISNFRLMTDITVDLEEKLSLIIGKNNTGKTSVIHILDKFLNNQEFSFEDFNVNLCTRLIDSVFKNLETSLDPSRYTDHKINLQVFIEYSDKDDLSRISKFIMDLDPTKNVILLSFDYLLRFEKFQELIKDFKSYHHRINLSRNNVYHRDNRKSRGARRTKSFLRARKGISNKVLREDIHVFIREHHGHYFEKQRLSLDLDNPDNSEEITYDDLKEIIGIQIIDAKRDVANTEGSAGKTLSRLSSRYYKTQDKIGPNDPQSVSDLQLQLSRTDADLTKLYSQLFEPVMNSVRKFATTTEDDAELTIRSLLRETSLFEENTFVSYQHGSYHLPESYSGLGYMNLFAIIFDIHIKLGRLKKISVDNDRPAEINLLCIEEPEAHTHPQMQYVFIKNIKTLLDEESGQDFNLQTIITTHSSHIVSQSDFEDIKYFYRVDKDAANVKNMRDLKINYSDTEWFDYLRRYLTLNNSELFFADKAIFIEGSTERILLPVMMQMVDENNSSTTGYRLLLSQNISIVEVGNYAHVFEEFLRFLEIKTLIITDIDSRDNKGIKCEAKKGSETTNGSIKHFLSGVSFADLLSLKHEQKVLLWDTTRYILDVSGSICIAYQTEENGYHGRTFEDAFIGCGDNLQFICDHKDKFLSLKNRKKLASTRTDYFKITEDCVDQKASFASDIYYHTNASKDNWTIPAYIREGLEWLAK